MALCSIFWLSSTCDRIFSSNLLFSLITRSLEEGKRKRGEGRRGRRKKGGKKNREREKGKEKGREKWREKEREEGRKKRSDERKVGRKGRKESGEGTTETHSSVW